MCQYSAVNGEATDWHFTHINTLALSALGRRATDAA
jgi:NADPH2 dehydrogenase